MGAFHARFPDATPWQIICLQCAAINGVIFLNDCYRLAVVTFPMARLVPSGEHIRPVNLSDHMDAES
jgi:hypothetical protein